MPYKQNDLPRSDPRSPDYEAWRAECARTVAAQRATAAYGKEAARLIQQLAEREHLSEEEILRRKRDYERDRYAYGEGWQRAIEEARAVAEAEAEMQDYLGTARPDDGAKGESWVKVMRHDAEQRAAEREAREREQADYETKAAPLAISGVPALEVKMVGNEARFSGYAATFGPPPDLGDDIIDFGAFKATIQAARDAADPTSPSPRRTLFPVLWNHDRSNPIGAIVKAVEDSRGLYVEGLLALDVPDGQRAYSLLSKGYVAGLSIGYRAIKRSYQGNVRHIVTATLQEVSVAPFPMNPRAGVTSISH